MSYLIITDDNRHLEFGDYQLFFIDAKLDQELFDRLLDALMQRPIQVYKRIDNILAESQIIDERAAVANGDYIGLEHYNPVDFFNNQYNHYLGLTGTSLSVGEERLNQLRVDLQPKYDLLLEKQKRLVIETYRPINKRLEADLNLFHHTLDASYLAFTDNPDKWCTYAQSLSDGDVVISKSSRAAQNNYYMLPTSRRYDLAAKLLIVNSLDYQGAYKLGADDGYILVLSSQLGSNQYVRDVCSQYQVRISDDLNLSDSLYPKQDRKRLLIISLVEQCSSVELYEYSEGEAKLIESYDKYDYEYQKMLLNYKKDLYYNY